MCAKNVKDAGSFPMSVDYDDRMCAENVKDGGSFPMSVDMMIERVLRM